MSADLLSLVRGRTQAIRGQLSTQLACAEKCAAAIRRAFDATPTPFKFSESELTGYLQQIEAVRRLDYIRANSVLSNLSNARHTVSSDLDVASKALERVLEDLKRENQSLDRKFENEKRSVESRLEAAMGQALKVAGSSEYVSSPNRDSFEGYAISASVLLTLYIVGKAVIEYWDASDLNKVIKSLIGLIGYFIGALILGFVLFFVFLFLFWVSLYTITLIRRLNNASIANSSAGKIRVDAKAAYKADTERIEAAFKQDTARVDSNISEMKRKLTLIQDAVSCVKTHWP